MVCVCCKILRNVATLFRSPLVRVRYDKRQQRVWSSLQWIVCVVEQLSHAHCCFRRRQSLTEGRCPTRTLPNGFTRALGPPSSGELSGSGQLAAHCECADRRPARAGRGRPTRGRRGSLDAEPNHVEATRRLPSVAFLRLPIGPILIFHQSDTAGRNMDKYLIRRASTQSTQPSGESSGEAKEPTAKATNDDDDDGECIIVEQKQPTAKVPTQTGKQQGSKQKPQNEHQDIHKELCPISNLTNTKDDDCVVLDTLGKSRTKQSSNPMSGKRTPKRKRPPTPVSSQSESFEDGIIGMKVRTPTTNRPEREVTLNDE